MALNDLTRDAVLRAIEVFEDLGREQFLEYYGFGQAREYWLVHNGRRYDSKAIAGVAHGLIDQNSVPLRPQEFSGGETTVGAILEQLGFEVEVGRAPSRSNPPWARDEIILALDVYVTCGCLGGGSLPGKRSSDVVGLSEILHSLPLHTEFERSDRFRNPEGVALKLANLRAVERDVAMDYGAPGAGELPRGMPAYSQQDRAVYEEFLDRWDLLHEEAAAIRAAAQAAIEGTEAAWKATIGRLPVEAQHHAVFESTDVPGGRRRRSEATLVLSYARHMINAGHDISAVEYRRPGETRPLRCDAFVWDLNLLVEAKASDARDNIRYAIGQLYDYRRSHAAPSLAVLLPYEPRKDLTGLLAELDIGIIWRHSHGFRDDKRGQLSS